MRARVTPEDLAGGALVRPDWYPCEIVKYEEREAKTDRSANGFFSFRILSGPSKGARARTMVNEKAWSFTPNPSLLTSLGAEVVPGTGIDAPINEQTVVGKRLDVYISRGTSDRGTEYNDPKDFAPIGTRSGYTPEK